MAEHLVRRAAKRDPAAFAELVRRYQGAIFATAYQAVWDRDAALDLAQETFVRAYQALPTLRDPAAFPAWLVRICRNLAADWRRAPERRWVSLDAAAVSCGDASERVIATDLVDRAFGAIPEDNRLALSLWLVDGYTYDEVARLTDVPPSTVKGRIERARRQLQREALTMLGDTLKQEAPGEGFTVAAVEACIAQGMEAYRRGQRAEAIAWADEAISALGSSAIADAERGRLRLDALSLLAAGAQFHDDARHQAAIRETVAVCEQTGDDVALSYSLYRLALHGTGIERDERDQMIDRAIRVWERTHRPRDIGEALFFRGWHRFAAGREAQAREDFAAANRALAEVSYGETHACLDATARFFDVVGEDATAARLLGFGACCHGVSLRDGRLCHDQQPGYVSTPRSDARTGDPFAYGFRLLEHARWLPWVEPQPGFEETIETHSYTATPTTTRVWLERDLATVDTPAGQFDGCLVMRATTTQQPMGETDEPGKWKLNRVARCGEAWCWLARGVGPVAYRREWGDSAADHAVLASFSCPTEDDAWVPVVTGARWEYRPAEPFEGLDARVLCEVTHATDGGAAFIAVTEVATRRG